MHFSNIEKDKKPSRSFSVKLCELKIRIDAQFPQGFILSRPDTGIKLIKVVVALGVDIYKEGTKLVQPEEPGSFYASQFLKKMHILYFNGGNPEIES